MSAERLARVRDRVMAAIAGPRPSQTAALECELSFARAQAAFWRHQAQDNADLLDLLGARCESLIYEPPLPGTGRRGQWRYAGARYATPVRALAAALRASAVRTEDPTPAVRLAAKER